jgi:hypothetical protein
VFRLGRFSGPAASRPAASRDEVPVLCRLWRHQGEWSAAAVDLPVAVSACGIEEAQKHLLEAIVCRLHAFDRTGQLESEVERLKHIARECKMTVEQMSDCELLWRAIARLNRRGREASVDTELKSHTA